MKTSAHGTCHDLPNTAELTQGLGNIDGLHELEGRIQARVQPSQQDALHEPLFVDETLILFTLALLLLARLRDSASALTFIDKLFAR